MSISTFDWVVFDLQKQAVVAAHNNYKMATDLCHRVSEKAMDGARFVVIPRTEV